MKEQMKIDIATYNSATVNFIVDFFRKKCRHEGQFGKVGAKFYICLDCEEKIFNPEWKHDREILRKLTKKELEERKR